MVVVDIKQYVCIIVFPNQKPHQDRLKSSRRWDAATLSSYLDVAKRADRVGFGSGQSGLRVTGHF